MSHTPPQTRNKAREDGLDIHVGFVLLVYAIDAKIGEGGKEDAAELAELHIHGLVTELLVPFIPGVVARVKVDAIHQTGKDAQAVTNEILLTGREFVHPAGLRVSYGNQRFGISHGGDHSRTQVTDGRNTTRRFVASFLLFIILNEGGNDDATGAKDDTEVVPARLRNRNSGLPKPAHLGNEPTGDHAGNTPH